jgi:predicted aldo/keto reductase-like oxidoreductase
LAAFNNSIEGKLKSYNPDVSIASWAFRWVGSLPNVKVILSGMSTLEQVQDNIKTFQDFKPLNNEELKIVEEVRKDIINLSKVDCTSCNYCMPCPHGVDIPGNFRIYNSHAMYENDGAAKWRINNLKKQEAFADHCINCGECLPKCPQFIEIPDQLANFEKYVKDKGLDI